MVKIYEWKESTYESGKELEIDKIFRASIDHNCSDVHLQVGSPPIFRIRGTLTPLKMPPITEEGMIKLCFPMLDQRNLDIFHKDGGADYAKVVEHKGEPWRFRINLLTQLVWHGRPVGLVLGIHLVTKGRSFGIKDHHDLIAIVISYQLADHSDHALRSTGIQAL